MAPGAAAETGKATCVACCHYRNATDQCICRPACRPLFLGNWAICIACISLPYVLMDRVQVRLYHGYIKGKPFWTLLKYAFYSTDYRPCYAPWWYWRWYYWW